MKIKKSIICKKVDTFNLDTTLNYSYVPKAGDVAVFEVVDIGKHDSIQGVNGNNSYIFPGDKVMMAFGNRYATGQFEGYVPNGYRSQYQILGKGGAVGELQSMNAKLLDVGPTNLTLIGYATDEAGQVINTKYLHLDEVTFDASIQNRPQVILSVGSSMDSGKTTTAAFLSRGLMLANQKVAFIKLTGTVYSKDKSFVRDCGAEIAVDFATLGFPSTYMCDAPELLNLFEGLMNIVSTVQPDIVVVEIADGLIQRETEMLLKNTQFMSRVSGVVFSCGDSLSAMSGISILEAMNQKIFCISGLFTMSPLLIKETRAHTKYPIYTLEDLSDPYIVTTFERVAVA